MGLIAASLFLLLIEGLLRATVPQTAYERPAVIGWSVGPHLRDHPMRGPHSLEPFKVSTNADGLRTTLERARRPATRRIAMLGDSQVFGWGVSDGDSLPARLEAALGPGFEVLNAGQPGYSTEQMHRLFVSTVSSYQPDAVVIVQTWHDFNSASRTDREILRGVAPRVHGRLWSVSHLYRWMDSRFHPPEPRPPNLLQVLVPGRVMRVPPAHRAEAREGIMAAAQGAPLLLLLLPNEMALRMPMLSDGYDPLASEVKGWGEARQVPVIDLRGIFADGTPPGEVTVPGDLGHFNGEGATRIAGTMAPRIRALVGAGR